MAHNEDLAARIRTILKARRGLTEKKMFGGTGFMINGNLACGVYKQDLVVRLSGTEFVKAIKGASVRPLDISGKPMKGWILVSARGYTLDASLRAWVEKGLTTAKSLPPK